MRALQGLERRIAQARTEDELTAGVAAFDEETAAMLGDPTEEGTRALKQVAARRIERARRRWK